MHDLFTLHGCKHILNFSRFDISQILNTEFQGILLSHRLVSTNTHVILVKNRSKANNLLRIRKHFPNCFISLLFIIYFIIDNSTNKRANSVFDMLKQKHLVWMIEDISHSISASNSPFSFSSVSTVFHSCLSFFHFVIQCKRRITRSITS